MNFNSLFRQDRPNPTTLDYIWDYTRDNSGTIIKTVAIGGATYMGLGIVFAAARAAAVVGSVYYVYNNMDIIEGTPIETGMNAGVNAIRDALNF